MLKEKRLYMCFVNPEKSFGRVPLNVLEWAMRKKGIPEVLVRSVVNLYDEEKAKISVDSELSA